MKRLRGIIVSLALAAGSLAATFATLECGVRVMAARDHNHLDEWMDEAPVAGRDLRMADMIRRSPDDQIVYELRPGTNGRFLGHDVRINALGMRDRERTAQKPPGVFRILVLGDSHLFGWGVAQDQSFAAVLDALLEARAPGRFEVLNAGVPGYNTVMETRVFERRVEELDPDLVLIHYVDNDMDLPNFLSEPADPWTLRKSFLFELIERRLALLAGSQSLLPHGLIVARIDPERGRYQIPEDQIPERYRPLQGRDAMLDAYRRLAALATARGIPYTALVNWHDYRAQIAGDPKPALPAPVLELELALAADGYRVIDPQTRVVNHLRANGEPTEALWITPTDTHMSPLYHRLAADEILAQLSAGGILPRTENE